MALFQKTEGSVGVDIGAHGIKLVELHKAKGRPQLWTYAVVKQSMPIHHMFLAPEKHIPGNNQLSTEMMTEVDNYAALLARAVKEANITTSRVTASLPVSQVFHTLITLPIVPEKELSHHVAAKVEKMLPMPIEDMQIVHQLVESEEKKEQYLRVLVTAAPKKLITFYTNIFGKAGLHLEELETEAFALERSLVGTDKATVMVIDIGVDRTNFFIIDGGVPITHRSIHIGGKEFDTVLSQVFQVDSSYVEQIKKDMSHYDQMLAPELFQAVMAPMLKEIEYSIDLFMHQLGNEQKRVEKIILTGGGCLANPIISLIKQAFPVNVFVGDPWARVVYQQGLKRVLDDIGPRMSVSIGLAMRHIM
ncbi:type IV pilus assembly protein PilM [Patescibacteria group bacterium]|nr:type IV pilus assembly protein PilM [Patescibacteria group bacterium]MBU1721786.1 type IV pilus assembly protein PilM [Patescibacteria group bacterium]MBU1901375.1 type IV pilus assembly protein PilM [Patescibacteria group bacterium]